jgi:glyoxylase-like metal-dependent hydrolase (beta-lactamase superfamily II)
VAVIDPGPDEEDHIRALVVALEGAREVKILLTHHHRDHAGAAIHLAREVGATIYGPPACRPETKASKDTPKRDENLSGVSFQQLAEGGEVATGQGELVVFEVPGHTRDHLAFHWRQAGALFVGDLLLGRGETTWVGEYLGCMGDYLASLDRVEKLGPSVIYPGHGPPISSPSRALGRFRHHRLERLEQVRMARLENPEADSRQLAAMVYGGEIPDKLLKAATASVDAALFHLDLQQD